MISPLPPILPPSRVLLCIDDRLYWSIVRRLLEARGYSVVTATNAPAAIKILGDSSIAAVLLEYKSEGLDAEAVAFQIKQRFPNEPIILLSAYSEMPARVLWLIDEYVMKSEPLEGLVQVIERATRTRERPKTSQKVPHSAAQTGPSIG